MPSRLVLACGCAAACSLLAARELAAFVVSPSSMKKVDALEHQFWGQERHQSSTNQEGGHKGLLAGLMLGGHIGLAVAVQTRAGRTTRKAAEAKEAKPVKYVETAADQRLFETVFMDYTSEYLKGPMYWHEDKLQGFLPDYPGTPMFKNGKLTSNATGNLKTFSSNELAFLSMLFFAVGLYGNLMFNYIDPQWARVDSGENFNVTYIVESFFLPISFFMHIACYIQKKNGK